MAQIFDWLNANDDRKAWRIALIALVVLSAGLGLRDPWPPDEPALALMAKTMADSGEWLIPYLGGQPFAGHPPFGIWLIAAFYDVTGSLTLSFLLPSLLASLGTLWLVYDLAKKLWGPRTGRLAATALLCTFQFMLQAHKGQVDALLMFWNTLALYGLFHFMLLENSRRWLQVAGAAMGMGILTKGLGYLPALLLIPYAWMRRQGWQSLPERAPMHVFWGMAGTCLVLVLAWILPALGFVSGADDAGLDQFRRDLLLNLAGGEDLKANARAFWYLPLQAMILWLPLSLLLPWKLKIWRDRVRRRDAAVTLLLGYLIITIAFFSVLPGKHSINLIAVLPAAALLVAPYLGGLWWRPGVQRLSLISLWGVSGLFLLIAAMFQWNDAHDHHLFRISIPDALWYFLLSLGGLGLLISILIRGRHRALGLPVFFFVGWILMGYWAYPQLNDFRTPKIITEKLLQQLEPEDEIAALDWRPQFELFLGRPLKDFSKEANPQRAAAEWLSSGDKKRWLLGPERIVSELSASKPLVLGNRHRVSWAVVSNQNDN